jgi:sortase A
MTRRRKTLIAGAVLTCLGVWQIVEGGWIHAKAALAKHLVSNAWSETLASGKTARPWPWADTWPVARLRFPSLKRDVPVLAGASGSTLAFGPAGSAIANARLPWQLPTTPHGRSTLTLVTCWPLDAIVPGGPLRYLVFAEETP